jgi:hypothetical protein
VWRALAVEVGFFWRIRDHDTKSKQAGAFFLGAQNARLVARMFTTCAAMLPATFSIGTFADAPKSGVFSRAQIARPAGTAPRPLCGVVPADNAQTPEKVALGKTLFFDTSLSADDSTACATRYTPDLSFPDRLATSKGPRPAGSATPTIDEAKASADLPVESYQDRGCDQDTSDHDGNSGAHNEQPFCPFCCHPITEDWTICFITLSFAQHSFAARCLSATTDSSSASIWACQPATMRSACFGPIPVTSHGRRGSIPVAATALPFPVNLCTI